MTSSAAKSYSRVAYMSFIVPDYGYESCQILEVPKRAGTVSHMHAKKMRFELNARTFCALGYGGDIIEAPAAFPIAHTQSVSKQSRATVAVTALLSLVPYLRLHRVSLLVQPFEYPARCIETAETCC